ncbi:microtubule-associated tumor suppressor 1 homolog A isoform X2 [Clinocottus analis]|uniref:microtubule-associated tumor suppressor 1 homolog A isoform X2 n=1 Tax=Clinocottus analis TaxID=304258 RepID=UPI0035C1D802
MSHTTFNMSTDQVEGTVHLPHRDALSPESQYSNLSLSPSPDFNSSVSNLSDREANRSPDVNILDCCPTDGSFVDISYKATFPRDDEFCGLNLNQTFIATPVDGSVNFWNETLSLMSNHEMGLDEYQSFSKDAETGSSSAVMSPDSAGRQSQLSSSEISRRGSTENDCCSLSSAEMVMRSNSFCQDDHSVLVVSSLEESFISLVAGHPAFPAESNLLSNTLPDVLESSTGVTDENVDAPRLGMTFTQAGLSSDENDMAASNSLVALPNEKEGDLLMTFLCQSSPAGCGEEAPYACAKAEGEFTPEQGKTFFSTPLAIQPTDIDIHTSTPLQNIGNLMPSLPSFSESPCTGNAGLHPVKQQQISATANCLVAGLPPSASKAKKIEIKKFPRLNFSSVKSKVLTRIVPQKSVSGPVSLPKQVNNKHTEAQSKAPIIKSSPANCKSSAAVLSTTPKMVNDDQGQMHTGAANSGQTNIHLSGNSAVNGRGKSSASPLDQLPAANKHASTVQCSSVSSDEGQAASSQVASSQVADAAVLHSGNQTLCVSSSEKKPNGSGQIDPKQTPKKGVLNKIEVRSGSALGQDKPPALKSRARCSSDSVSLSSRQSKDKRTTLRLSTSFTVPKAHLGQNKPGNLNCSSLNKQAVQTEATNVPAKISPREVKRISLVAESSKSTAAGASSDESRNRFRGRPSPRESRGAPFSQPPAASPRSATLSTRQWQGAQLRDENKTSNAVGTSQSKRKNITGGQGVQATGEPSLGTASTPSIKPQLLRSRPPHTPTRPSLMGPPPTPTSRLPRRTPGPSGALAEAGVHTEPSDGAGSTQVSGAPSHKPSPFKTALKARLFTTQRKNTGPSLATACKPAASTSKATSNSTVSPLKRTASARLVRPSSSGTVDKSKPKANSHQRTASQPNQHSGPPDVVPASVAEGGAKDQSVQKLSGLLAASNCRFQAIAIVLQQTLAERDEATRQCRDLSQELVSLRGELVCSEHSSERLEKEKDELRVVLQDALHKLQEQHQDDLVELEQRLQVFYQAEWDKVHLTYQEETDKCKTLMQQQMAELKANHEAMKLELESSHAEQLLSVKQQYDASLEEVSKVHTQELQSLEKTLKEEGAALSEQIQALTVENNALIEKLTAVENRRKQLAEKNQDSHTLYLEQELESLKVVLDIKNKQLHQQEKKLMEIDALTEKKVKLDESHTKVQQENEDLKARMERHYALSRQLSTEQAALQESLQKESKVNKRLSMENEELMWKLHNGDPSSPRRVSPTSTSPSRSFSLQSPRSSGAISSPPVSPR